KLAESLGQKGVDFALAHVHDPVEDMARATGLLEKVGQDRIFPSVAAAVQWARSAAPTSAPSTAHDA
ncbi:MAG TPA: STAS domain-containing protein, partial [Acidimicrobiales bacterium]|nr:STAS domain-containing protein [Acidimicrobiales bacterium]